MDENVAAFEIGRMLIGDEPPLFLAEIVVRTVIIYFYTLLLIRWIGVRSIAQLSLVEFLLVIALGSAVGDAMFYPDVPLIHCMVVITAVVLLDKFLGYLLSRSPHLEDAIAGRSVEIIRDGVIRGDVLGQSNFGREELFEQLRLKDVTHLGQVRAAYLETNGMVSVFKSHDTALPGLSIEPPWDVVRPAQFETGARCAGVMACADCGTVLETRTELPRCPACSSTRWHRANTASC